MIRSIRRLILKIYVFFFGVKFHVTNLEYPFLKEISSLKILLPQGIDVNFVFYQNTTAYYFHVFNILRKRDKVVYTILVNFTGDCCADIVELFKLRLHFNGMLMRIIGDDNYIYEQLASMYLSIITNKYQTTKRDCVGCKLSLTCKDPSNVKKKEH